jgi:hypothetical protein
VTVCSDMGSFSMYLARYLYSFRARQLLISNGQQTLGVALPWGIAATLVRPQEKVLSISGDGGFLFSANELETAVRLKSHLVHMIWIDGSYDMVGSQERIKYNRVSGVDFGPVDPVKYAEAFGATGLRIDRPHAHARRHASHARPRMVGYEGVLADDLERIEDALKGVYRLALGGTAVGTGINSAPGFGEAAAAEIAKLTGLPFVSAPNKFTVQGAHDAQVQLSGTLRTLAVSLYKIANDIRLMSCGPRAGFAELQIPENEPGSSIMPGKVNPTQAEALTMIAVQVMADDVAVGFGGAGGYLEMNVYKPLIIFNVTHSITIMADGCTNFRKFLVEGTKPNLKKINEYVERSLMLVTALSPVIGYDKASKIAHYAMDNDLTLKAAALKLGFVTEAEFDRIVDPRKMVTPYVAAAAGK